MYEQILIHNIQPMQQKAEMINDQLHTSSITVENRGKSSTIQQSRNSGNSEQKIYNSQMNEHRSLMKNGASSSVVIKIGGRNEVLKEPK